ncbi:hypothetical protein N3K66_007114 [Trichothecium roseum]|uniref:Uncharacterized protein n=1 Tax=Trichothecium roseum TaxID=47278 RepID=A0ACC0UXG1_9HYPO|nr:hypothetical protein N3K66_007114 [Trichothecium roseum]
MDTHTNPSSKTTATAGVTSCDMAPVPALLASVASLGERLLRDQEDQEARLELLRAARKLWLSLETPRETVVRHTTVDPPTIVALTVGSETGLWEHLARRNDDPFKAADVAVEVGVDPPLLSRFMRHLAATDYLVEAGPDTYERTHFTKAMGQSLVSGSYAPFCKYTMPAYSNFPAYAASPACRWTTPTDMHDGNYQHAAGTRLNYLEHVQSQPGDGHRFARHMELCSLGRPGWADGRGFYPVRERLVDGFDGRRLDDGGNGDDQGAVLLVDVGGSTGHDLMDLCAAYPDLPGRLVLQDLPVVLKNAGRLDPRIDVVEHDFFTAQPVIGARAYYLHSILHDWPDEACITILSLLRAAMRPAYSRLLIHDVVIPDAGAHPEATGHDVAMLALLSGMERRRAQWEGLVTRAGLKVVGVWAPAARNGQSVIECEVLAAE